MKINRTFEVQQVNTLIMFNPTVNFNLIPYKTGLSCTSQFIIVFVCCKLVRVLKTIYYATNKHPLHQWTVRK
jgi:hypothetical protein